MKTMLAPPDELMRAIKVRAAQQDRKINDIVAELLRSGLAQAGSARVARPRGQYPGIDLRLLA